MILTFSILAAEAACNEATCQNAAASSSKPIVKQRKSNM